MRVVTNQKLVQRNRKITQYLFFFSLGVLILGFIVTNAQAFVQDIPDELFSLTLLIPSIVLPIAFITTLFSVRMTNLWVRQPRPDQVMPENLKGFGNKAVMYNYFHMPARHVLIVPQGVFAIVTRFQDGRISVSGSRWRRHRGFFSQMLSIFRLDGLGNPGLEAEIAAEHLQEILNPIAPDIQVQPLVVFVDPRAQLTIENPTVPVLHASTRVQPNLKDYLRGIPKDERKTLTPEQLEAFEAATLPAAART
jgi:hypothetical protein